MHLYLHSPGTVYNTPQDAVIALFDNTFVTSVSRAYLTFLKSVIVFNLTWTDS